MEAKLQEDNTVEEKFMPRPHRHRFSSRNVIFFDEFYDVLSLLHEVDNRDLGCMNDLS